jgi:hypothetical protein
MAQTVTLGSVAIALLIGTLLAGSVRAETIDVVVPWHAQGQIFVIDVDKARFLGSIEGIMFAESDTGAMNEAYVQCPIVQDIDEASGRTSASGNCVITTGPEDNVFAELHCEGARNLCRGVFTITGGTGRFAGATGSGAMTARSPVHTLAKDLSDSTLIDAAIGIIQLRALEVSLP